MLRFEINGESKYAGQLANPVSSEKKYSLNG